MKFESIRENFEPQKFLNIRYKTPHIFNGHAPFPGGVLIPPRFPPVTSSLSTQAQSLPS